MRRNQDGSYWASPKADSDPGTPPGPRRWTTRETVLARIRELGREPRRSRPTEFARNHQPEIDWLVWRREAKNGRLR